MSDYIAVKQYVTMEFTCYGCNHSLMIDPNNQDEVKKIEPWLKLQDSAGASLGFCGQACLKAHVNGTPKIVLTDEDSYGPLQGGINPLGGGD